MLRNATPEFGALTAAGVYPQNVPLWDVDLWTLTNLVAVALLYYVGVYRARKAGATWSNWLVLSFTTAITLLAVSYVGPLGSWAHTAFWPHMSQHLVVMMLAGPLIVLSNPVHLLFLNLSRNGRRTLIRILRGRVLTFLTNPWVGWFLFATVLLGSHIGPVMNLTISDHDFMMFIERPLYLAAALIFYYPLLGNDLIGRRPNASIRVLSLGLMMIPETTLGMLVHFAPVPLYDAYVSIAPIYQIDPMLDQKFAGAIMWAVAMVLDGFWMMFAAFEWWKEQEQQTRTLERRELQEQLESSR